MPEPNTELIPHRQENFALGRLMPETRKELYADAQRAAASPMFPNVTTPEAAFLMMGQGIELGLTPFQALRELVIISGKVDVPASVRAAKIASSPKVSIWDVDADDDHCTITAKRRDRDNECVVTVKIEDMSQADRNKHREHLEDWLYARAVRRISRRYFPDLYLGMESDDSSDPDKIINIAAVEKEVGDRESVGICEQCGKPTYLHPSRNGGVYSECADGHRQSPPQEVRDAVRGRGQEFNADEEVAFQLGASPAEPHAPTPEQETQLRNEWTHEIVKVLVADMTDNIPHALHKAVLTNWGWDGDMRVADWLATLELGQVADLRDELALVEL